MLRFAVLLALVPFLLFPAGRAAMAQEQAPPLIGITAITITAEIQAVIDGMRDRLAERGYRPRENIAFDIRDSAADPAAASNLIRDFVNRNVRVIVAITNPSIRIALAQDNRIPIVGTGLTMDQAWQITRDHRRRPITGIAESDTRADQFALIRVLAPEVITVAVPVDPINGPTAAQLQELVAIARAQDLTVTPLPVSVAENAVDENIRNLDPDTTALFLDVTVLPDAPVEALAAAAAGQRLRLFSNSEDSVIRGALATMVIEPYGIGQQLGDMVADILENPTAARRPFERARASHLVFNEEGRTVLDVSAIETEIADRQQSVIDWAETRNPRPKLKPAAPEAPPPLGVVRGIKVPTPRSKPPNP